MFESPDLQRQRVDDLAPLQAAADSPLPAERRRSRAGDRSRWHWLLAVAVVVPLLTPLYNRVQPRLLGLPFFYWSQMAFIVLGAVVSLAVYQITKKRGA